MNKFIAKGKKVALTTILSVITLTANAFAGTITSATYSNKNTQSDYKVLGSGTHYLEARSINGSGTAQAKKIIKWWPDSTVADVDLNRTGDSGRKRFSAQRYNDDGVDQSYYIRYNADSSSSKAQIAITH